MRLKMEIADALPVPQSGVDAPRLLTVKEAALVLRIHPSEVKRLVDHCRLKAVRIDATAGRKRLQLRIVLKSVCDYQRQHPDGKLMSVRDAADYLRLTISEIQGLIAAGKIKTAKDGHTPSRWPLTVLAESLKAYVESSPEGLSEEGFQRLKRRRREQELDLYMLFNRMDDEVWQLINRKPLSELPVEEAVEKAKWMVIERLKASGEGCEFTRRFALMPKDLKGPFPVPTPAQIRKAKEQAAREQRERERQTRQDTGDGARG